jgi:ribonuclease BN (tRNA processing enzyme)
MARVMVKVLGCGDAFGSGGRLQPCFLLDTGDERVLIDCGATAMIAMRQHEIDPVSIDAVVLSHLHGDHFGGVPLMLLEAQFVSQRDRPLTIAGPPGTRERLAPAMEVLYPGSSEIPWRFPLEIAELAVSRADRIGNMFVVPYEVDHPSGAPAFALRVRCGDQVIAYSGDTEWTEALLRLAHDADLLIMECFGYTLACKSHMDYQTLHARLPELCARRTVLTHMSQEMLDQLDQVEVETAYDGMVIELPEHPASLASPKPRARGAALGA